VKGLAKPYPSVGRRNTQTRMSKSQQLTQELPPGGLVDIALLNQ